MLVKIEGPAKDSFDSETGFGVDRDPTAEDFRALCDHGGLTVNEVAAGLGESPAAVKARKSGRKATQRRDFYVVAALAAMKRAGGTFQTARLPKVQPVVITTADGRSPSFLVRHNADFALWIPGGETFDWLIARGLLDPSLLRMSD